MHIVIDARIRRASTGRPVDRLLEHVQALNTTNRYTVLTEPSDDWKPSNPNFRTAVCRYKQFSLNPLQQITFALQLYRLKPDLVHFTMTGQQPLFYFGRQMTFTHDLTMFEYARAGGLPQWLHKLRMLGYRLLMWQAHKKAKKILVPTQYVRGAVARFHPFARQKLVVTPEASEPPLKGTPEKLKGARKPFILYVGNAFPHKNLESLVDAFEILRAKYQNLQLVMAGKKEYHYGQLEKYVNLSPARDAITLPGFVTDLQLKWLYQNAEAYVFPSLSEGFGLPALEAMVHGCPVASSNATCLPEVYGRAAAYFSPNDIQEMADTVFEIIENKTLRRKLINAGYEQVKKYSWRRMAERTLAVYKGLA